MPRGIRPTFCVETPISYPIARLKKPVLDPGIYINAGSAISPCSIRARGARHLRVKNKPLCYIDCLPAHGGCINVKNYSGVRQCNVFVGFLEANATISLVGFDSFLRRDCVSQLCRLAAGIQNSNIAVGLT